MVAGTVKGFNLPIDYVLYEMSFENIVLYGAVLPSYKKKDKKKAGDDGAKKQDVIKADDPRNRARVRKIFDEFD